MVVAAPDAELLAGRGPRGVGLVGGSCVGAGTLEANSAAVIHLGKAKVPALDPIWGARPLLPCQALLTSWWLALPYLSLAASSSVGGWWRRGMRSISCEITYWVMLSCHESPATGGGCETWRRPGDHGASTWRPRWCPDPVSHGLGLAGISWTHPEPTLASGPAELQVVLVPLGNVA